MCLGCISVWLIVKNKKNIKLYYFVRLDNFDLFIYEIYLRDLYKVFINMWYYVKDI